MRVVLLLAAGAAWETQALSVLGGRRDLVVLKRCVDVDDLLATATSGQADSAVVAVEAPGFDVAAVDHLRRHGVRPVAVVADEPGAVRAERIGVRRTVTDVAELPVALTTDAEPEPPPEAEPEAEARAGRGTVTAVWGPVGAPGRTTVATAMAAALGRTERTTLIDVDPYGGTVAQVLGVLDEVSGLLAAARLAGSGRLVEGFASVQRALDGRLTVVTGLPRPDRWSEVRPGTIELLAETARTEGHVVLDAGPGLDEDDLTGRPSRGAITRAALEVADEIVAVGTADPVGLSRLARALTDLRAQHPVTPVRVVVNRMRPTLGWSERDVAAMLADFTRAVAIHFLPEDRATVDRALVTGRTVQETAPASPLAQAVDALVGRDGSSGRLRRLRPRTAGTTRPR
ncbi:hypothetical protein G5V58_16855 [Nocardioides anomalus]|uniref:CobQ/CobB/MinD/ParA nucleotide binding domain-containing protein n=1 Tax=Nocardioides anomalus TaxID=2712223 RepID=A0A6G6WGP1_9ACTN|nr:hypothetical protein [Nocardioides anomalus]QIG44220.1 hypothetical protein G5V58_16855 [Nocardioides anomalus]